MRWLAVALLLFACEKTREAPPPDEHPPMADTEEERSQKLCQAYADRICRCADKEPKDLSLRDDCDLAKAEPTAVRMHLEVLHGAPLVAVGTDGQVAGTKGATPAPTATATPTEKRPPLNENERRLTEASLRKVVAACVELDAKLDPAKCPR
jgi:hypothetical protein